MAPTTLLLTTATVLALCTTAALGYGTGAPDRDDVCTSMRPGHRTKGPEEDQDLIDPQSGTPWYTITVSKNEDVKAGEEIEVTIVAMNGDNLIEGFFIQARDADPETALEGEERFGTWTLTDGNTQQLRCSNQAVTHHNKMEQDGSFTQWDNVTLYWRAPSGTDPKNLAFWATVLKNYKEFFMFVRSPIVNSSGAVVPSLFLLVITSVLVLLN